MKQFAKEKALIEDALAARISAPDVTDAVIQAVRSPGTHWRMKGRMRRFMKKALIAAAACTAAVLVAGYLFVHFYFQRTFPYELKQTVIRCSAGIERSSGDADWQPVRSGDTLRKGVLIRTPEKASSFLSMNGIRLWTQGEVRFEAQGPRTFSLHKGELFVAIHERKQSLTLVAGDASLRSGNGVFRVARSDGGISAGVVSGSVDITAPDGRTRSLTSRQNITLGDVGSGVELVYGEVVNPFTRLKPSVLERIKERFAKVIAQYLPQHMMAGRLGARYAEPPALALWSRPEGMFEFAFYRPTSASLRFGQTGAQGLGDYYESLFSPSNRVILIGKEKVVPLEPTKGGTWPTWSHDGSMIAFNETERNGPFTRARVVRLDDLNNPWDISQEYDTVLPMFGLTWSPDDRHVLFLVTDNLEYHGPTNYRWNGPYKIKIAPLDPAEEPLRDFDSPFYDIPLPLPIPVGKTISPEILKLPWGDAMLCANWGNLAYIPVEPDGQSVSNAPGMFLTNFNPREFFVMGGSWSPSGSKVCFTAVKNLNFTPLNAYILYDVEDILDGFAEPPRSVDDPRIKQVDPTENGQFSAGFSYDESIVFFHEDVNGTFRTEMPTAIWNSDFDLFYGSALRDDAGRSTQIHLPGNQMFHTLSPEGNRLAYCNYTLNQYEMRIVSFDIEADIDADLGGVLIDNSGTNLIVPPGALEENLKVRISTPFSIGEEAEIPSGESHFFAMRLIDAAGIGNPKFIEPMTLTIRYTDDEVTGLDEGMLEIYHYDESDPEHPVWVPLGGTVEPDHNEITVEIRHFSKFSVGGKRFGKP